jgi:hypothetical protein
MKIKRFGHNLSSYLIGVTHNSNESRNYINKLLNENKNRFNYFIIELNKDNYHFILKNNFHISEYYQIIKLNNKNRENIILCDVSIEKEVEMYYNYKYNNQNNKLKRQISVSISNLEFYDNFISYKLSKFLFYKMTNILPVCQSNIHKLPSPSLTSFYHNHILYREKHMNSVINRYKNNNNILIIVGYNHFESVVQLLEDENTLL